MIIVCDCDCDESDSDGLFLPLNRREITRSLALTASILAGRAYCQLHLYSINYLPGLSLTLNILMNYWFEPFQRLSD